MIHARKLLLRFKLEIIIATKKLDSSFSSTVKATIIHVSYRIYVIQDEVANIESTVQLMIFDQY